MHHGWLPVTSAMYLVPFALITFGQFGQIILRSNMASPEESSMDEGTNLDLHVSKLQKSCRVCGSTDLQHASRKKAEFLQEFQEMFGIDVSMDDVNIHPEGLCRAHEKLLLKCRDHRLSGKTFTTSVMPIVFKKHDEKCSICSVPKAKGRKRKKPTRTKQQIFKEIIPDTGAEAHSEDVVRNTNDDLRNSEQNQVSFSVEDETLTCSDTPFQSSSKSCLKTLLENFTTLSSQEKRTFFSTVLKSLTSEEISNLAFDLGNREEKNIREDIEGVSKEYLSHSELLNFESNSWITQRNNTLVSFISGLTAFNIETSTEQDKITLCRAIEQIYSLRFQKLVAPMSFLLSLNIYTKTSSRQVVDMLSKSSPSGSYSTLSSWIAKSGSSIPKCPSGSVIAGFDNEQVIGYKRGIGPHQKSRSSIITTQVFVPLSTPENTETTDRMQMREDLKPPNCFSSQYFDFRIRHAEQHQMNSVREEILNEKQNFEREITKIRDQASPDYEKLEQIHYQQLHHFIQNALDTVISEQFSDSSPFTDNIDETIHTEERKKDVLICTSCGTENARRKLICTGCQKRDGLKEARGRKEKQPSGNKQRNVKAVHINVEQGPKENTYESSQRYSYVPTNHTSAADVTVGMPTFVNPNSNETVALVLRHIGIHGGIKRYSGEERQWMFVCCDGRPHSLYQRLLEDAVICDLCKASFMTLSAYREHHRNLHKDSSPSCSREFDWLYMRIGAGHYEMNAVKAFFELNWIPFLEKMCELMGFVSENAKQFAKSCKDHHVAWQLLLTFHTTALQEMVVPYVRYAKGNSQPISVESFITFYKEKMAENPNCAYLNMQVFRFSQAIINFRMGIRRNNAELVRSAKFHIKELFYGRFHPHYQKIELFDAIQYQFMPKEVREVWDKNASFTVSGDKSKGQDLDFILEEKNRAIKQYLPSGTVPSDETWKSICCNLKFFETLQEKTNQLLGMKKPTEYGSKTIDVDSAVRVFRPTIRKYLAASPASFVGLNGSKLHPGLLEFLKISTQKRMAKINIDVLGQPCNVSSEPVFVTENEEHSYQHKLTKAELSGKIKTFINYLTSDELLRGHYAEILKSLEDQNANKATYATLYFELKDLTSSLIDEEQESDE